jgi:hypothetical protein
MTLTHSSSDMALLHQNRWSATASLRLLRRSFHRMCVLAVVRERLVRFAESIIDHVHIYLSIQQRRVSDKPRKQRLASNDEPQGVPTAQTQKECPSNAQPSLQDSSAQRTSRLTSTITSRPTAAQGALYPVLLFSDIYMLVFPFHLSLPAAPAPQS